MLRKLKLAYAPSFDFKRFLFQTSLFLIGLGVVLTLNVEKHFISLTWLLWATFIFLVAAFITRPIQKIVINFSRVFLLEKLKPFLKDPNKVEGNEVLETTDKIFTLYKEILVSIVAVFTLLILYAINYKADLDSTKIVSVYGIVGGSIVTDSSINGNPIKKIKKATITNAKIHVQFVDGPEDLIKCNEDGSFAKDIEVGSEIEFVILEAFADRFPPDIVNFEIQPSDSVEYTPVLQKDK